MTIQSFKSFLLLEYNADVTWKKFGAAIHDRAARMHAAGDNHEALAAFAASKDARQHILPHLEATDPTANKQYVPAIARIFARGGVNRFEDLRSRMRPALATFHDLKNKGVLPMEHRDIGRLKSLSDLEDIVEAHGEKKSQRDVDAEYHEAMKREATITDHPTFTHIVPHTAEASCHFGRGTRWCTAATKGENLFHSYVYGYENNPGPLQIFVPKSPKRNGEKYQFHSASTFSSSYDKPEVRNEKDVLVGRKTGHPEIDRYIDNHSNLDLESVTKNSPLIHRLEAASSNAKKFINDENGYVRAMAHNFVSNPKHVKKGLKDPHPEVRYISLWKTTELHENDRNLEYLQHIYHIAKNDPNETNRSLAKALLPLSHYEKFDNFKTIEPVFTDHEVSQHPTLGKNKHPELHHYIATKHHDIWMAAADEGNMHHIEHIMKKGISFNFNRLKGEDGADHAQRTGKYFDVLDAAISRATADQIQPYLKHSDVDILKSAAHFGNDEQREFLSRHRNSSVRLSVARKANEELAKRMLKDEDSDVRYEARKRLKELNDPTS